MNKTQLKEMLKISEEGYTMELVEHKGQNALFATNGAMGLEE